MILKVMERIVTQTIPAVVIDNPRVDWNPHTIAVTVAPGAGVVFQPPDPRFFFEDFPPGA